MTVELVFNAPNIGALHKEILAYVRALDVTVVVPEPAAAIDLGITPKVNGEKPMAIAKKPKANAKPEPRPEPEPQPEPLEDFEAGEPAPEPPPPPPPTTTSTDPVANEKIKSEVITQMQEWFAAGRVKLIRKVLDEYGEGAKSFPEIPAQKFVAIREAIKTGAIA